jgi:segregation and condensation protein B
MIEKAVPPEDKPAPDALPPEADPAGVELGGPEAEPGRVAALEQAAQAAGAVPPVARPLAQRVEALLFASGQPLGVARLAQALEVETPAVQAALDELALAWRAREGAIELVEIAGGWRFMTRPAFHPDVAALRRKTEVERLSPAALESLAVVAYRQPITRADIEAVRGVQCGPVLRLLLDRDLIRITGRSPDPGHPLLYGTTKRFLDHFGLKSLKALPDVKDLLETP